MEYQIAPEKKTKTKPYSILIQKSKGCSAFDEQKVKNIAIEYRLQSIFATLFFVLPSKLYCDIMKETQSYLELEEARHR